MAAAAVPAAAGQAAVTRMRVNVLGHQRSASAGFAGMLVGLARADGITKAGQVRLKVSYGGFASAYAGGYGQSLSLFTLPACAMTTPGARRCQGMTPVKTVNNWKTRTLTAIVTLPATGQTVLTANPTTSNGAGDFKASSLTPSSSWNVGLQTGDFAWDYPLRVPPPIAGQAPALALSYDSGITDGETAQGNSQPGQLGEGFSLAGAGSGGYIERRFVSCGDLISGTIQGSVNNTGQTVPTGDQCWDGYNGYLNLGGRSTAIIYDPDQKIWRLADDDGSEVNYLHGATNGAYNGSYWEIVTSDGTQYWFGLNELPGWQAGDQATNSVWTVPVVGLGTGDPHNTPNSYANSVAQNMPWRWNLDLVVDPNGNATSYFYNPETNNYLFDSTAGNDGTSMQYDSGGTLASISYGSQDNASDSNNVYAHRPLTVSFTYSDRCPARLDQLRHADVP